MDAHSFNSGEITMRQNKFFILMAIFLMFAFSASQAATTYNETVSKIDVPGALVYYGTVSIDDTTTGDTFYTQAFMIAGVAGSYGYGSFYCAEAGTEDVNVFIEYSNDLINWTAGTTDTDVDAVGTTVKSDTIGIVDGNEQYLYKTHIYARLKLVPGQTVNSTTFYYFLSFRKPAGLERTNLGATANKKTS